jgi:hypothetical protein
MATAALERLGDTAPPLGVVIDCARTVVDRNWSRITLVADELVRRRQLDYAAFEALIGGW